MWSCESLLEPENGWTYSTFEWSLVSFRFKYIWIRSKLHWNTWIKPPQSSRSPAQQRRHCMAEATNPHSSLQGNRIQNQQGDTTNLQSQSLTTYRKSTSLLCLLPSIRLLGNLHSWCSSRTSPAWSRGIQTWQPAISDTEGPWRALREVVHSCSSPSELNGFLSCNTKYFFKNKSPETCFKCHFELNIITWMF